MPNTYTQIHIQAVFPVKYRRSQIQNEWKNELYKYITGIVQNHKHKMLAINGMPDHLHVFFGMRPTQSISDLLQNIKGSSSEWINDQKLTQRRFEWQQGYGAFSYCKAEVQKVIVYIHSQELHHRKKSFLEEYRLLLEEFEIEFDEQFIFKELE
jgi:putative transposase